MKKIFKSLILCLLVVCFIFSAVSCKKDGQKEKATVYPKVDYTTGIDFSGTPLNVVENGVAKYSIVVPAEAPTILSSVVNELTSYITQVSGAKISVFNDASAVSGNFISIGNTAQFKATGIDVSKIKDDGFIIKTVDGNVYVASNIDQGIMSGVYSFIERFLGIRWLTESVTHVPDMQTISVYPCDILEEPTFARRVWYDNGSAYPSFYNHRRYYEDLGAWYYPGLETPHNTTDYADSRRSCGYVNKYDVVNKTTGQFLRKYDANIDAETECYLMDLHPEYFTDMEGTDAYGNKKPATPSKGDYDICFTSGVDAKGKLMEGPSAVRYIIEKVKNALIEDASARKLKYFQIAEMDASGAICNCNTCVERREAYNGGGVVVMFINCIENEINTWLQAEQGRKVTFSTFAYHTSVHPPVKQNKDGSYSPLADFCVANDNVQIRVAPIGADYTYSFQDKNQIKTFNELFEGWDVCSKEMRVWDYVFDFYARTWYYPNFHYLKENFIYYKEKGVVEVFDECGRSAKEPSFWTNALKSYVVSKLYWNLGWDVSELVDEFMELYYGVAAPAAKEFLNLIDGHYAELRETIGSLDMAVVVPSCNYYNAEKYPLNLMTRLMSIVDNQILEIQANETLTETQKEQAISRIKVMKITPMAMIFKNYDNYYNTLTKKDFAKDFLTLCEECGIVTLGGGETIADLKNSYGVA